MLAAKTPIKSSGHLQVAPPPSERAVLGFVEANLQIGPNTLPPLSPRVHL
jgi:hypothetical protein